MTTKADGIIAKTQTEAAAKKEKKAPTTIKEWIQAYQGQVEKALPKVMTPERFTRIALSAVNNMPKLAECTPQTFIAAMMNAAQLGLEPNTPLGQAYLLPFKNKGVMECQFQIGYKGLIDLAYRSGNVKSIQAQVVYENDDFVYELGLEPKLIHKPAMKDRGEAVWVYAVFKLVNGGEGFEVMSIDDCHAHAKKYSKAYSSGYSPWQTNFEEMCKKTVIKRVLKYAPLKSDFVQGMAEDETIKSSMSMDMSEVPNEIVINPETGEVLSEGSGNDGEESKS